MCIRDSGWTLKPAGEQIPLSTLPMNSVVSPDGKHVLILQAGYMPPTVTSHDAKTMKEIASVRVPDAWMGLAFAPQQRFTQSDGSHLGPNALFYVGGGSKASVFEFELMGDGKIEARRTFTLVAEGQRKHTDFIGDVAISPDGHLLYAAALHRDSIFVDVYKRQG